MYVYVRVRMGACEVEFLCRCPSVERVFAFVSIRFFGVEFLCLPLIVASVSLRVVWVDAIGGFGNTLA